MELFSYLTYSNYGNGLQLIAILRRLRCVLVFIPCNFKNLFSSNIKILFISPYYPKIITFY